MSILYINYCVRYILISISITRYVQIFQSVEHPWNVCRNLHFQCVSSRDDTLSLAVPNNVLSLELLYKYHHYNA